MYSKKAIKQTAESKEKAKFRQSAKWKKYRAFLKKECNGYDLITNKKLLKGYQVHHKDMRIENYKDISDSNKFIAVNRQTHEVIHWLYRYYASDPEILERLQAVLNDMIDFNK